MKKLLLLLGIPLVLLGILVMLGVGTYNGLINKEQAVDAAWAQVENVYQRRADLVPNLVATVSGAADFEKSTLTAVTDARDAESHPDANVITRAVGFGDSPMLDVWLLPVRAGTRGRKARLPWCRKFASGSTDPWP